MEMEGISISVWKGLYIYHCGLLNFVADDLGIYLFYKYFCIFL